MIKSLYCLLFFCLWMTITVTCQTQQQTPAKLQTPRPTVEQAQMLLSSGKVDAAIELLSSLSKDARNDIQTKYLLGVAYYQKSDFARAVEHLSVALRQVPESSKQYRQGTQLLGFSHYFLGRVKEAIPYLEKLNEWSPHDVEVAYVLGSSYIQIQNTDKSREAFARMFNVPPNSAPAYLLNAQMMIRQRLEELAEKELQKALELDPKLPQANFLLGELAIYHANIDRGIELLEKEIAVNPAFGMAYYRLGEAYTRQLKWDDAMAPLQKSIWLNPYFSGPYIVLGKVHLKKGDLPNAESILRRALRMDPNNFSGHHLLAQVLQQANRLEEAKKEFELAAQLQASSEKQ